MAQELEEIFATERESVKFEPAAVRRLREIASRSIVPYLGWVHVKVPSTDGEEILRRVKAVMKRENIHRSSLLGESTKRFREMMDLFANSDHFIIDGFDADMIYRFVKKSRFTD